MITVFSGHCFPSVAPLIFLGQNHGVLTDPFAVGGQVDFDGLRQDSSLGSVPFLDHGNVDGFGLLGFGFFNCPANACGSPVTTRFHNRIVEVLLQVGIILDRQLHTIVTDYGVRCEHIAFLCPDLCLELHISSSPEWYVIDDFGVLVGLLQGVGGFVVNHPENLCAIVNAWGGNSEAVRRHSTCDRFCNATDVDDRNNGVINRCHSHILVRHGEGGCSILAVSKDYTVTGSPLPEQFAGDGIRGNGNSCTGGIITVTRAVFNGSGVGGGNYILNSEFRGSFTVVISNFQSMLSCIEGLQISLFQFNNGGTGFNIIIAYIDKRTVYFHANEVCRVTIGSERQHVGSTSLLVDTISTGNDIVRCTSSVGSAQIDTNLKCNIICVEHIDPVSGLHVILINIGRADCGKLCTSIFDNEVTLIRYS